MKVDNQKSWIAFNGNFLSPMRTDGPSFIYADLQIESYQLGSDVRISIHADGRIVHEFGVGPDRWYGVSIQ